MSAPVVLVVEGDVAHDVFEVIEVAGDIARVRSPYLFEIGEELTVRLEREGAAATEHIARVRAHTGPSDAPVTELVLSEA